MAVISKGAKLVALQMIKRLDVCRDPFDTIKWLSAVVITGHFNVNVVVVFGISLVFLLRILDNMSTGRSSCGSEVMMLDDQTVTVDDRPPSTIGNVNVTQSSRVHIGPKFVSITQNVDRTKVVKGKICVLVLLCILLFIIIVKKWTLSRYSFCRS